MGNFIYIDFSHQDYKEHMKESLCESLDMVLSSSGQPKFVLTDSKKLNSTLVSEVIHQFPEKLIDPQAEMSEQAEEEEQAWSSVKFHTALVMTETELKNCKVELNISNKMKLCGKAELMEVIDVPPALMKKAEIQ